MWIINWIAVHWEAVALIPWVLFSIHYCWGFRENMNLPAWLLLGVFISLFFASNAFRLVPDPAEHTLDAAIRWVADVRLYSAIGYKACAIAALCVAFFYRDRMRGSAALLLATVAAAMFGEFLEFSYCRLNDPVRGFAHVYLFEGGRDSACHRAFGVTGNWFTPVITVLPSIIAMRHTAKKKAAQRAGPPND